MSVPQYTFGVVLSTVCTMTGVQRYPTLPAIQIHAGAAHGSAGGGVAPPGSKNGLRGDARGTIWLRLWEGFVPREIHTTSAPFRATVERSMVNWSQDEGHIASTVRYITHIYLPRASCEYNV